MDMYIIYLILDNNGFDNMQQIIVQLTFYFYYIKNSFGLTLPFYKNIQYYNGHLYKLKIALGVVLILDAFIFSRKYYIFL